MKNVQTHWKRRDALVGTLTHGGFKEGGSTVVYDFSSISDMPLPPDQLSTVRSVLGLYKKGELPVPLTLTVRGEDDRVRSLFFSPENIN